MFNPVYAYLLSNTTCSRCKSASTGLRPAERGLKGVINIEPTNPQNPQDPQSPLNQVPASSGDQSGVLPSQGGQQPSVTLQPEVPAATPQPGEPESGPTTQTPEEQSPGVAGQQSGGPGGQQSA